MASIYAALSEQKLNGENGLFIKLYISICCLHCVYINNKHFLHPLITYCFCSVNAKNEVMDFLIKN
jgi:hypothetical protein